LFEWIFSPPHLRIPPEEPARSREPAITLVD
jgi:hypothetical protein